MRALSFLVSLLAVVSATSVFACDQLNRPMPVTTGGTSSSASGAPATDAGSDAELPPLPLPGEGPRVTPQPGDVQL